MQEMGDGGRRFFSLKFDVRFGFILRDGKSSHSFQLAYMIRDRLLFEGVEY